MPDARSASPAIVLNFRLIVPFVKLSTPSQHRDREVRELLGVVHQLFVRGAVQLARAFDQQLRRVVLAGHPWPAVDHDAPCRRRPARSTQVPTIGSNVAGGLPTVSLLRSTLMSARTQRRDARAMAAHAAMRNLQSEFCNLHLSSSLSPANDECADHGQRRPDAVEHRRRALGSDRQRVSAKNIVVSSIGGLTPARS